MNETQTLNFLTHTSEMETSLALSRKFIPH